MANLGAADPGRDAHGSCPDLDARPPKDSGNGDLETVARFPLTGYEVLC